MWLLLSLGLRSENITLSLRPLYRNKNTTPRTNINNNRDNNFLFIFYVPDIVGRLYVLACFVRKDTENAGTLFRKIQVAQLLSDRAGIGTQAI